MVRLLLDENFDNDVLRGVLRHKPDLDYLRVQDIPELYGADDPTILEWAAQEHRVLFTHDVRTMTRFAYDRIRAGLPMAGVFEVSRRAPLGEMIDALLLVVDASSQEEWQGKVNFLPFR